MNITTYILSKPFQCRQIADHKVNWHPLRRPGKHLLLSVYVYIYYGLKMQSLQTYSFLIFQEDDYDIITDNYKAEEGSLAERKATIKALRQSGGLWASNRFPASLSQDMFYQMTDLDKGIYGRPYNVSLFLHVSYWPFFKLISKEALNLLQAQFIFFYFFSI